MNKATGEEKRINEEDFKKIEIPISEEAMNKIWRNILIYARKEFETSSGRKFFYNNCSGNNNTIFVLTKNGRKLFFSREAFKKTIELKGLSRAKLRKIIPCNPEIKAILKDSRIQVEEILQTEKINEEEL